LVREVKVPSQRYAIPYCTKTNHKFPPKKGAKPKLATPHSKKSNQVKLYSKQKTVKARDAFCHEFQYHRESSHNTTLLKLDQASIIHSKIEEAEGSNE